MTINLRRTGTDDDLVPLFKHSAIENPAKSQSAGRPIFDDVEVVEIRIPGSRDVKVFPALVRSHWGTDPYTGAQREVSYAERFAKQYQQFKTSVAQTKSGTLIDHAPFLTEARRAELRAFNVYTVEQLANIDGQELKNLGPGGRELKNQAIDYIAESKQLAPNLAEAAELEALRARNQALEADNEALKLKREENPTEFDEMSNLQLKDYIERATGARPLGNPARKTLIRAATEAATSSPLNREVA